MTDEDDNPARILEIKVVIIGEQFVGKTLVALRFEGRHFRLMQKRTNCNSEN